MSPFSTIKREVERQVTHYLTLDFFLSVLVNASKIWDEFAPQYAHFFQ